MSSIPEKGLDFYDLPYNNVLKILLLHLIFPLLVVFTVILYVYYSIAIINMKWPDNTIYLIMLLIVIMTFVVYLLRPLYRKNKLVYTYSFILPKVAIPLMGVMFFSLYLRISNYGITELRYYAVLLGFIILGIFIYWGFSSKKNNSLVLIIVALVLLITTFTPISAYELSINSQNKIMKDILEKNDILIEGNIEYKELEKEDYNNGKSIYKYFKDREILDRQILNLNYYDFHLTNY